MELVWITMRPRIARANQKCNVDAEGDLYSFDSVQEQESETLVKDIQVHHLLEGSAKTEIIFNNYLWFPYVWMKKDFISEGDSC